MNQSETKAARMAFALLYRSSSADKKQLSSLAKALWKEHANTIWGRLGIFWYCLNIGHYGNARRCSQALQKSVEEMDGQQAHFYWQCMHNLTKASGSITLENKSPSPSSTATPSCKHDGEFRSMPLTPIHVCKQTDFQKIVEAEQEAENRKQLETLFPLLHLKSLGKVSAAAISGIEHLMEEQPNMAEALGLILGELRARLLANAPARLPPLLLCGSPGAGKTRLISEIARLVGLPYTEIQLAGSADALKITGLSRYWRAAGCGLIARTFCDHAQANPIFILDEIDKAGNSTHGNPLDAILLLLEENTAKAFRDEFVVAPINASHASFIATANSIDSLPEYLLSRFIVVEVPELSHESRIKVAASIYRQLRISEPYGHFFVPTPDQEVVETIARNEAMSPRHIRQSFKLAMQQACRPLNCAPHSSSLIVELTHLPKLAHSKKHLGFVF